MDRLGGFAKGGCWLVVVLLWGSTAQIASASFDYYYNDADRFALYGQQDNFIG